MDRRKTGELIAQTRREKNMTQKELAQRLHVSDRAVSKWERGMGFPDVSLLEPLAAELDLQVLDLLRGERTADPSVGAVVQEALAAVQAQQQANRTEERKAKLKFSVVFLFFLVIFSLCGFVELPLHHTVLAGVYVDGVQTAVTEVEIDGGMGLSWTGLEYRGALRIPMSRISMDEERDLQYRLSVRWKFGPAYAKSKQWKGNVLTENGPFVGNRFCLTPMMREFAFEMTNGCVIATTPEAYVRYAETYSAVPIKEWN